MQRDDREQPKQHRSRHHKQEHRPSRDTRRRNRSPSENHHLLILRMMIIDHPHQEAPDLEDMSTQGVIGQGPVGARDLNDEEEAHLERRGGHDQKEERVSIDHPKVEEGGIPPLHHKNKNLKGMWKTGINPDLPNQLKQRQRNLNK